MSLFATHIIDVGTGSVNLFAEAVDDRVAALLIAGAAISITYNDGANTLTIASTASGTAEWGGITGTLSAQSDLQSALGGKAELGHTHTAANVTDFSEAVDDRVAALLVAGTNISITYDDPGNTLTIASTAGSGVWGSITGTLSAQTDLQSALDGKSATGHTHTAANVTDFSEAVDDRVAALLVAGSNITLTYDDPGNTLTVASSGSGGAATDWGQLFGTLSNQTDLQAALDAKQTLDAELTAIAGLTSAADTVAYFTGSGTASLATLTAAGRAILDDADATAQRATLGLVIGTNVQAYDAELAAIAGLTSAADRLPYFTGLGTASLATFTAEGRALAGLGTVTTDSIAYFSAASPSPACSVATFTAFARTLLDDTSSTIARATLGVTIGTHVQGYTDALQSLGQVTPAADRLPYFSASGTTAASLATFTAAGRALLDDADATAQRATLGLVIGTNVQAYDAELAAIAGLTSAADQLPYFTGSGTASLATLTAAGRAILDDADATAQRATLGLVIGTNVQAYDAELAALAGLTSAANGLPYFTGSGTAALATLTAAGRALIDDADAAAQRTTLGLGTVATLNTVPVANGGTGLTALGTGLQVLRVNAGATALEYAAAGTGTPAGSSTQMQYNNAGAFGGAAQVTYATSGIHLLVRAGTTTTVPIVVRGASAQSANLFECQNISNTVIASVSLSGAIYSAVGVTAANFNKVTVTAPATGSTLTIAEGKTLTASNTLTFVGTDGSTLNVGTGASLSAISVLTSAADKLPYFTGAGTAAVTDLTAFGRSLVGAASAQSANSILQRPPSSGPGYRANYYYSPFPCLTNTTRTLVANRMYLMPMFLYDTKTWITIGFNVTTAVGGTNARLGIYANADGLPTGAAVWQSSAISMGTTGEKEDVSLEYSPTPGWIWLAIVTDTSAVAVTAEDCTAMQRNAAGSVSGAGSALTFAYMEHTFGALPTIGALVDVGGAGENPPKIWLRY